jgi:hypothetical protein
MIISLLFVHWLVTVQNNPKVSLCTSWFKNKKFPFCPTKCVYVFCVDLITDSDYFPIKRSARPLITNAPRFN